MNISRRMKILTIVFSGIFLLQQAWASSLDDDEIWTEDKGNSALPYLITGALGGIVGLVALLLGNKSTEKAIEISDEAELTPVSDSIVFTKPDGQEIIISNDSPYKAQINGITYNLPPGVSETGESCSGVIGVGQTCGITLEASQDAYGNGSVVINYGKKELVISVGVEKTKVELRQRDETSGADPKTWPLVTDDIQFSDEETSETFDFAYVNKGNFTWQETSENIVFKTTETEPSIKLVVEPDSAGPVEPGEVYQFSLQTQGPFTPGSRGAILAKGSNLENDGSANAFIIGTLVINPNINVSEQHLAYRSVSVTNSTGFNVNIDSIECKDEKGTLLKDNLITHCDASKEEQCSYLTTCGGALANNNRCLIWLKAEKGANGKDFPLQSTTGDLEVRVNYDGSENESKSFAMTYDNSLYATGTANAVYKWNGGKWTSLSGNLSGKGRAMNLGIDGDLYLGGEFQRIDSTGVNYVAQWNGNKWLGLGSGFSKPIYALAVSPNSGELYAGGDNVLKRWNESKASWESIAEVSNKRLYTNGKTGQIFAINFYGDTLYIAGLFSNLINMTDNSTLINSANFAKWEDNKLSCLLSSSNDCVGDANAMFGIYSSTFYVLETAYDSTIYSFALDNQGNLLFVNLFGGISKVSPSGSNLWSQAISGYQTPPLPIYYAVLSDGDDLYMGGSFAIEPNIINIAKRSDGALSRIGNSYTSSGSVYAMTKLNNELYFGGSFTILVINSGSIFPMFRSYSNIVQWDGTKWSALGDSNFLGEVRALIVAPSLTIN